ncbi:nibrin isoform X1 [Macrobrachium rosenbergii]|uniref:nibrin isoform X1 n=1 Tax=Macrobrachium rosenbergii TaxID=79674 RepID=UPI0034D3FACC
MWVLVKEDSKTDTQQSEPKKEAESSVKIHYLICGPSLVVGRKASHILLPGDNSISRQHASITIIQNVNNLKNPNVLPEVKLKDLGAKYGTYVNDGIEHNQKLLDERVLVSGDRVRFGLIDNVWRLKHQDLIVTTSALQPESKGELQTALLKLGGHLVGEWMQNCSYLVMNNITLTIKVVCALAAAAHIVTPDFFTKWADAIMKKAPHPDASDFLPPLQEMSINQSLASFSPNEERMKLFKGKHILFPSSKQLKRMGPAIELAGGVSVLLSEENYKLVSSIHYLLVQLPAEKNQEPARTKLFWKSKEILKGKGLRVIPESDIGLAILYRSTEAHCNPSFDVADILKRNGSSSLSQGAHIYATETQDATQNSMSLTGTRIVPESGMSSSRKTPATLQTTAAPPTNAGLTTTSLNSFSSTNASTLMTLDSISPGKNCSDDKENFRFKSTKRNRTQTTECEPPSKRSSRSSNTEPVVAEPEPTQPLENLDEEEELISEDCGVSKFEPKHVSTQKYDKSGCRTNINGIDGPSKESKGKTVGNVEENLPTTLEGGISSLEPLAGRSIPFEPYTLPSLNAEPHIEDDISTQTYGEVKTEPPSQPEDEPDCCMGKRKRKELHLSDEDVSNWFGKKSRAETATVQVKTERVSVQPTVKQEVRNDDLFAIPNTSDRSKRRAEAKKRLPEEGASDAADLFDLPTSSRVERRRKIMKTEESTLRVVDNRDANVKDASSSKYPPVCATSSNVKDASSSQHPPVHAISSNASTSVNERGRSANTSLNDTWISKKGNDSAANATKSPVKAEAVVGNVVTKNEPRHGDVAELAGSFERSLVVVEVASLVRQKEVKTTPASSNQNHSSGNLKNFKKFRKNSTDIVALPKIIGGKGLVPHDKAEISSRDNWFRENPDVTTLLAERNGENNAELDNLFEMAQDPRSRGRARRKK